MAQTRTSSSKTIGKWRYPERKFVYEKTVLIKQTNVFGNTYFSNYIEWQGEAREKFFLSHPAAPDFLKENPHLLLITHSLFYRFIDHAFFGDTIQIELTARDTLEHSLVIVFKFYNKRTGKLIGEGWQKICFSDTSKKQPCAVPRVFLDLAQSVEVPR